MALSKSAFKFAEFMNEKLSKMKNITNKKSSLFAELDLKIIKRVFKHSK